MLRQFRLFPFIAGLIVGYLVLMYYKAPAHIVLEYPHPDNVKDRTYRDKNGVCYSYTSTEVNCDKNEATLEQYPIQA